MKIVESDKGLLIHSHLEMVVRLLRFLNVSRMTQKIILTTRKRPFKSFVTNRQFNEFPSALVAKVVDILCESLFIGNPSQI